MEYVKLQNLEQSYAAEFNNNYVKRHCKFNIRKYEHTRYIERLILCLICIG